MPTIVKNKKNIFILVTSMVVMALVLPDLVRHGMFMDGTQYACVSKNLADGKSTFWLPFLNSAWDRHHVHYFLEHPPLVYYLQSKFFILCNNSFLSERLYCLFTLLVCIFFIYKIWLLIFKEEEKIKEYWWLPVFIWIIIPSVSWSFKNNMHENTLSVFVLASAFFAMKSVYESKGIIYIIAAGFCIFLATLSKGLPGLFPLSILFIHYFACRQISLKKTIFYSIILFFIPALIYCLIYFTNDEAKFSLDFYLKYRLADRINNNPEVYNRFTILLWVFTDLLVPIIFTGLLTLLFKLKSVKSFSDTKLRKLMLFFILFSLAGIIPLTFTYVQRAVYFVPAMPFLAFAFAIVLVRGLDMLTEKITQKGFAIIRTITIAFFIGTIGLCVYLFGKTGRDEWEIKTAKMIAEEVGENKTIGTSFDLYQKWSLQFYLLRYYDITIDGYSNKLYEYQIYDKDDQHTVTKGYTQINEDLEEFKLYKRN